MTTLAKPLPGELNIPIKQGNTRTIPLEFIFTGWPDIETLHDFDLIRMTIKDSVSVRRTPFLVFEAGSLATLSGLEISEDGTRLTFVLDERFYEKQTTEWVYDIAFLWGERRATPVNGKIYVDLTVGKI